MVYCNLKEMSPQRKDSCDETPLNSYIDSCVNNMHLFDSFSKKKSEQGMLETSSDDHVTSNQFQNNISCKIENDAYPSEQTNNGELDEIQSETDEKYPVLGINFVPKTSNLWDPLVQSAEQDQVKVEDVYTTDSSMPSLEISSNDPYKVEAKVELFTEDVVLDEPAEKVAEYNHSIHSTNSPQEITFVSTDGLHNAEVKLEQFSEEENSNSDPCSTEEPLEQHLEEVTLPKLEYSDEDPGYSKHQENSSQGAITPSAKKGKHLPNVKKSTQNTGNISKEVKVQMRDSFPYCCDICDMKFSNERDWARHQQDHSKPFCCEVCNKRFTYNSQFIRHGLTHSEKKRFKCGICDARFKHNDSKVAHERRHEDGACFECAECGKKVSQKFHLIQHLRLHSGVKPFSCQTCSKSFALKVYLTKHQRTHGEEKPYKCRFCDAGFKHSAHKSVHERVHMKGACFECTICGKKFSYKENLAAHLRVHSNVKPFSCQKCSKSFTRKTHLTRHQRMHSEERPFKCRICNQQFKYDNNWAEHERSHVEGPRLECAHCGDKFRYKSVLVNHITSKCTYLNINNCVRK